MYKTVGSIREAFSVNEIRQLKRAFTKTDKDKSNLVDAKELNLVFKRFNLNFPVEAIPEMMQRVNSYFRTISETTECQSWLNQESYQIDFFQFLYMCATETDGRHAESFKKLSKIMKEKSKKMPRNLSDDDFQQILLNFRQAASTLRGVDPIYLFRKLDKDRDYSLTENEFRNGVKSIMPDFSPAQFHEFFQYMATDLCDSIDIYEFCYFVDLNPTMKRLAESLQIGFAEDKNRVFKKAQAAMQEKVEFVDIDTLSPDDLLKAQNAIRSRAYRLGGVNLNKLFSKQSLVCWPRQSPFLHPAIELAPTSRHSVQH